MSIAVLAASLIRRRRPTRRAIVDFAILCGFGLCSFGAVQRWDLVPGDTALGRHDVTVGEWLLLANLATLALVAFAWRRILERRRDGGARRSAREQPRATAVAYTDALTGVASGELFGVELREAAELGHHATLLLVEVSGLERIVATIGREEGARILAILAKRLRAANDTSDLVARLDDSTFAVLMRGIAIPDLGRTMGELMARAVAEPIFVDRHLHRLTAAIGVTLIGPASDDVSALERAHLALAQARQVGRSAVSLCAEAPIAA